MAVITISRQIGSGGEEIARRVCQTLDYRYFEKRLMNEVATELGLLEQEVIDFSEERYEVKNFIERFFKRERAVAEVGTWTEDTTGVWTKVVERIGLEEGVTFVNSIILAVAKKGKVVIVGRGGQAILKDTPGVLHVRIIAPVKMRVKRVQEYENISLDDAQKMVEKRDRAAEDYLKRFHGTDISDLMLYHLVLNTGKWDVDTAIKIIVNAANELPS